MTMERWTVQVTGETDEDLDTALAAQDAAGAPLGWRRISVSPPQMDGARRTYSLTYERARPALGTETTTSIWRTIAVVCVLALGVIAVAMLTRPA